MTMFETPRTRQLQHASLTCPTCNADITYQTRHSRKWYHRGWRPFGNAETCALCTGSQPDHGDQATRERLVSLAMLKATTVIALRLDEDTPQTREAIIEALDRSGADHVSSDDIDDALRSISLQEPRMDDLLAPIADMVSQTFKEAALQTLYRLLTRNHGLTRETFSLLMEAAFALDMSPADIRGAIHELLTRPRPARETV